MKEHQVTRYIARDGQEFTTAGACRAHEFAKLPTLLAGLTEDQVEAALQREDVELADLMEEAGKQITQARLAAGDRRRRRKGDGPALADPESRGAAAFIAGQPMGVPEDFKTDPAGAEGFRRGYSRACAAAEADGDGIAPAPVDSDNDRGEE